MSFARRAAIAAAGCHFPLWFYPSTGSQCGQKYPGRPEVRSTSQYRKDVSLRVLNVPRRRGSSGTFNAMRPFSDARDNVKLPSRPVPANTPIAKKRKDRPRVVFSNSTASHTPVPKIHPDSQTIKVLFRIILFQRVEKRALRVTGRAVSGVTDKKRSLPLFQGIDRSD